MERDLVEAAQRGDRDAFGLLVGRSVDRLFGTACLILRDRDRAEDAVQEALVRAWRDLPTLRDVDRFPAWLRRLLVRACADVGRTERRFTADVRAISLEPTISDTSAALADRDELERALRRLTLEQRTLLVLRYHLDLSLDELAETLDVPVGTVKSRLHYATDALRAALDADARGAALLQGRPA
jgi:RNA polymerase sigma-70 factor (ECF subfamily)